MNRHCGWIKTDKGYASSCGRKVNYHRGYMYCPFCGRIINIIKVGKEQRNDYQRHLGDA